MVAELLRGGLRQTHQTVLRRRVRRCRGIAFSPATELMMAIEPPLPASSIAGTVAFSVFQAPTRLMSTTSVNCSSDSSHTLPPQVSTPALAITCPAVRTVRRIRDELLLEAQVARISLPRKDLTPDALDEPDGLGEVLGRWRRIVARR